MRKFTQFIKGEKETRLDVHCFNLKGREGEELFEILKNLGFIFCYIEPDSLLAFLTGRYSYVKETMKSLKKYYGFTWPEDPVIIGVSDNEMEKDFLAKSNSKKKEVSKMTKKQLWEIYNNSPSPKYYWEHWDEKAFPRGSGLLLSICPHCGAKQTRENYISCRPGSFWSEWITLIQDYEITGISKCAKCGQWCQAYG